MFFRCVFDLSTARWARTNPPDANTCIQFYGSCRDLNADGILRIKLESIALNVGSGTQASASAPATTSTTNSAPVTPAKRRKFSPPAPDSSPDHNANPSDTSMPSHTPRRENPFFPGPSAPMHYNQLFQQFPQPYLPQSSTPFPTAPASAHSFYGQPNLYGIPAQYQYFHPPFPAPLPLTNAEQTRADVSASAAPGSQVVHTPATPTPISTPTTTHDTAPTAPHSAFERSAADPYAYPMTQV